MVEPYDPNITIKFEGHLFDAMRNNDYYIVVNYYDISKPVEIHRKGCSAWNVIDRSVRPPKIFCSYGIIIGTLQEAERNAEEKAEELRHPGWKKEPCCNGTPCTPRVLGKDIDPQWGKQGDISHTRFANHEKVK